MERITIYQFTDPICVWSWGNEAVIRALRYLYAKRRQRKGAQKAQNHACAQPFRPFEPAFTRRGMHGKKIHQPHSASETRKERQFVHHRKSSFFQKVCANCE